MGELGRDALEVNEVGGWFSIALTNWDNRLKHIRLCYKTLTDGRRDYVEKALSDLGT